MQTSASMKDDFVRAYMREMMDVASNECIIAPGEVDMIRLLRTMRRRLLDRFSRIAGWRFKRERPLGEAERVCHPEATVVWEVQEIEEAASQHMGLPQRMHAFIEAANNCTALCAGMCLVHPMLAGMGLRMCIQSNSLGKCTVISMHTSNGYRLVDEEPACNPLLIGTTMLPVTMLPPPQENIRKANGNRIFMYEHNWLAMALLDAEGKHQPVSMDPTAAQFGSKDILVWHPGMAAARDLYATGDPPGMRDPQELREALSRALNIGQR